MCRGIGWLFLGFACGVLGGCAVTTPDAEDIEQVRGLVAEQPGVPIAQLSREVGIAQSAVVAALPEDMRREVPVDDVPALLEAMAVWGEVELDFDVIGHGFTYRGLMPHVAHETARQIELTSDGPGLSMSLAKREFAAVWLIKYPAGEAEQWSVVFYEELGEPWLVVRVQKTSPAFDRAWEAFSNP